VIGFAAGEDLRFTRKATEGTGLHHAFTITLKARGTNFRRLVPFALQQRTLLCTTHTTGAEVIAGIN